MTLVQSLDFTAATTTLGTYLPISVGRSNPLHKRAPLLATFCNSVDTGKTFVFELALVQMSSAGVEIAIARFRSSSVTEATLRADAGGASGRYLYNIAWPASSNHLFDMAGAVGITDAVWKLGLIAADSSADVKVDYLVESNSDS